jgi:phage baseplate assembly protein W
MASLFYPFKAKNGTLVSATGALELKQKIIYLLRTRRFSRVLNQDFGLPDPIFDSSTSIPEFEIAITQQIKKYFPEVEDMNISVDSRDIDSGRFLVTLEVRVNQGVIPPFQVEI